MHRHARPAAIVLAFALLAFLASCAGPSRQRAQLQRANEPTRRIALSFLSRAIYLVDPTTGRVATLADGIHDPLAGFAMWSPDGRSIAYGDNGILISDPATGSGRVLVRGPSLSMPAWSPNGRSIAYGDGRDLWVTPATSIHATYLHLPLTLAPLDMTWTPASEIAFAGTTLTCHVPFGCTSTSRTDLWIVGPDGTGLRRLTHLGDVDAPRWSRDGSRVLFVRTRSQELWTADADGSHVRRLGTVTGVLAADWSPDASSIALARMGAASGTVVLDVMAADGGALERVAGPFHASDPSLDW